MLLLLEHSMQVSAFAPIFFEKGFEHVAEREL